MLRRRDSEWVGRLLRLCTWVFLIACAWVDLGQVRNLGFSETTFPTLMATLLFELEIYLVLAAVVMSLHLMTAPPLDRGPKPRKKGAKQARA